MTDPTQGASEKGTYDLHDHKQILELGARFGIDWVADLHDLIDALGAEERVIFFAALFGGPLGSMCAAIGCEAAKGVLSVLGEQVDSLEATIRSKEQ